MAFSKTIEFNSSGGTSSSNGLHVYISDNTQIQIIRNTKGQVFHASRTPPNADLDNGIYLRANGAVYGATHNYFSPSGGTYSSPSLTSTSPSNPSSNGTEQTATSSFGISTGPQVNVVWKYKTPLEYVTAEVTVTIPASYSISTSNPVRYYHAFDTYLSGSDSGCNFSYTDTNGKRLVGTYKPSGSSCSSSTSIPSGVSVVEAFRERTDSFSNYCSSKWSSFWSSDSNNCYIAQSSSLNNTVNTSYQDTGIGIQYSFTSSGTYTFSYDFVVGTATIDENTLIAYYNMDETSWNGVSNEVIDSSGNGYNATAAYRAGTSYPTTANSTRAISGSTGTCGYGVFTSNQYVSLPSSYPNLTGSFTITAWFNTANASQLNQRIFSDDINNSGGFGLTLNDGALKRLKFFQRNPDNSTSITTYAFQSNTWYFVAVTVSAGSAVSIYLYDQSGTLLTSKSGTHNNATSFDSGIASIGNEPSGSSEDRGFNGSIDEIRLYTGALSTSEIAALSQTTHVCPSYITNISASSFNCVATSADASTGHLYTQLAGTTFNLDVVALNASNAVETGYAAESNQNITLEFVDGSGSTACASRSALSPAISQTVTFSASDFGRKSASVTISKAYQNLSCRVTDSNSTTVTACSSDNFAVRPTSLTISSSNANADTTGSSTSATPAIKLGSSFALTATADVTGYSGTPSIDTSKLSAHSGATAIGSLSGSFSAANTSTGVATGSTFNYSEVGYFRLAVNGVYDSTFTAVDSASGDCTTGFTASGGINACSFGNTSTTNYFGRFIPDHFAITAGSTTPACGSSFSYFGQDGFTTAFTLTAQNASNTTTQNYTGSFAKLSLTTWSNFAFTAATLPSGSNLSASDTAPSGSWSNGAASVSAKHEISRPTSATAPTSITVYAAPTDSDGVTVSSTAVAAASAFRYGRLWMSNIYGSELLNLTVPIEAQYWDGSSYRRNQLDSCSVISPQNIAMGTYKGNLAACESVISGGGTVSSGKTTVTLAKPGAGNNGSVDLSINFNSAAGSTCTSSTASSATNADLPWFGSTNPTARETFGLFKSPVIYMRESY